MGIYIKGMEMPKNCLECFFHKDVDISVGIADGCEWLKEMVYNPDERLEDCPLVPVSPHGRLIDADEFYKSLEKWIVGFYSAYEKDKKDEKIAALHDFDLAVRAVLADAPTIIPAKGAVSDGDKGLIVEMMYDYNEGGYGKQ